MPIFASFCRVIYIDRILGDSVGGFVDDIQGRTLYLRGSHSFKKTSPSVVCDEHPLAEGNNRLEYRSMGLSTRKFQRFKTRVGSLRNFKECFKRLRIRASDVKVHEFLLLLRVSPVINELTDRMTKKVESFGVCGVSLEGTWSISRHGHSGYNHRSMKRAAKRGRRRQEM